MAKEAKRASLVVSPETAAQLRNEADSVGAPSVAELLRLAASEQGAVGSAYLDGLAREVDQRRRKASKRRVSSVPALTTVGTSVDVAPAAAGSAAAASDPVSSATATRPAVPAAPAAGSAAKGGAVSAVPATGRPSDRGSSATETRSAAPAVPAVGSGSARSGSGSASGGLTLRVGPAPSRAGPVAPPSCGSDLGFCCRADRTYLGFCCRSNFTYVFQGRSYGRQARAAGCWVVCLSAARRASFNASMSLHRALPAFRCAASRPAALIASMSVCQAGSGGAGGTGGGASGGASSRNAEVDPGRSDRAAQREAGGGGVGRVRRRRGGRPRFGVGEGGVDGLAAAVAAGCGAPDLHLATVQRRLDLRRRGQRHGRPWWSHRIRLVGCGMRRTLLGRRRLPSCYDWRAWRQAVSDRCTSTVWRVRSTSAAGRRPSARCHR